MFSTALFADEVEYVISGVDDPMLTNVRHHVSAFRIGHGAKLNSRLRRNLLRGAEVATIDAMRPFGYFHPRITMDIRPKSTGNWVVSIDIDPGPPVLVNDLKLEVKGPGRELELIKDWYLAFPLTEGKVLYQPAWDKAKLEVVESLEEVGYLQTEFSRHIMRVDTVANTASLELVLDTGPQAVMGTVTFNQDILNDGVLDRLQRFEPGVAYSTWLMEKFRLDLWRIGYFEDIEIIERRVLTSDPPRVDLEVNTTPRKKNTYQGTLGFGTDTLTRLQFLWGRHLLSRRGDNFDIGFGWQQRHNEFTFQTNYRLPRETKSHQFWIASFAAKSENQSLKVSESGDIEDRTSIASGRVNDYSLKLGKTRVRNMQSGFRQLFETMYVKYLKENRDFKLTGNVNPETGLFQDPDLVDDLFVKSTSSLALGMEWDWPEIRGSGFKTVGHHERAWIFTANDSWGSDVNFSQVYASSRFNFLAGDRWKLLLRAEAGFSDARTSTVTVPVRDGELELSTTELPFLYRFKAGGSRSVRGYSFEVLDNNGLGSNSILTASAEIEYLFHDKWSIAAFTDMGNAFNDWSEPDLKLGSGLGLRWYSIIGALRLDLAKGWDRQGDPWQIHLTIGTVLF
jgi:translocation and assembly module TamA